MAQEGVDMAAVMAQIFSLSTLDRYKEVISSKNLPVNVETVSESAQIGWFGSPSAPKVLLYSCGGGLVHPGTAMHMQLVAKAVRDNEVAVGLVIHGLAPASPYPGPLRDYVAILNHVLKSRSADSIYLAGDSAGGLLNTMVLTHAAHPHPSVPALALPASQKFAGALLICPGGPNPTSAPSMTENEGKDILTREALRQMFGVLASSKEDGAELPNPWFAPETAPEGWWGDLPIGEINIVLGDYEVLRDDILQWAGKLKELHSSKVEVHSLPATVHCQFFTDALTGAEPGAMTKMIEEWLRAI